VRWLVATALFLVLTGEASGEERLTFGFEVGFSVSNAQDTGSDELPSEFREDGLLGAVSYYRVNRSFGVRAAIEYVTKGYEYPYVQFQRPGDPGQTLGYDNAWMRLRFIEVPILASGVVEIGDDWSLHGLLGPSLGVLVSGTLHEPNGSVDLDGDSVPELSAVVGAGFDRHWATSAISLDLQYRRNLTATAVSRCSAFCGPAESTLGLDASRATHMFLITVGARFLSLQN